MSRANGVALPSPPSGRVAAATPASAAPANFRREHFSPPPFIGQQIVESDDEPPEEPPKSSTDPSVFIGNLPYDLSEALLSELLSQFGPLEAVRLLRDSAGQDLREVELCVASGPGQRGCTTWRA